MKFYPTIHGLAGVGALNLVDEVSHPSTESLILKLIIAVFSLIPTIREIFGKKKQANA